MLADRLKGIAVSATLQVAAEAARLRAAGVDVVDLGAGEPDFDTPAHAKAAGIRAIEENFTRYTPAAGIPELRQAVCARYRADYGVTITPSEVLITAGGKQSLFNAALALFNARDEVITHAPCWPLPGHSRAGGRTSSSWRSATARSRARRGRRRRGSGRSRRTTRGTGRAWG